MMITKKAINDDIAFIIDTLKNREVMIPSFLSCASPGIAVMLGMSLWQFFISYNISTFKPISQMESFPSICFSLFFGFMLFLFITSARGKYLSLPVKIREESLIVKFIRHKAMLYFALWVSLGLIAGLLVKHLGVSVMFLYATQFLSAIILHFIALVDLGRYDLAVLGSVIKAWQDGDKLDPEQLKKLDI